MNKNDIVTLEITDVTEDGNGVGKVDGTVVFVPFTAVGDTVTALIIKVKTNYSIGKLIKVITPSKSRITPDCECFLKCGGCVFRHIDYDAELSLKQRRAEDCVNRIAGIHLKPKNIVSDNNINHYRNKMQLPVGKDGAIGFFANHSHRIVECSDCLLQPEIFNKGISALKRYMRETNVTAYDSETGKGLVRHFYLRGNRDSGSLMAVLVINGTEIPNKELFVSLLKDAFGDSLKSVQLNVNTKNNNVILGYKNIKIFGVDYITDEICGINVRISPNSFYQVNRNMAQMLYDKAKEYAKPQNKTVLDLYCGTGTIGLTMAKDSKKVIGVEIIEDAIKDAKENAKLNGIENAEFICSDASKAVSELKKRNLKPDIVILDPPRKGCEKSVIETVAKDFSPQRVVYVSCNPATLARDLKIFVELGYKVTEYTPFDLFPRTGHVETVALIEN